MDKIYKLSRMFLTFLIFTIILMCLDEKAPLAYFFILPITFGVITYLISFLTSIISKKIFFIGNEMKNTFFKIVYYIGILIVGCLSLSLNHFVFEIILYENSLSALMSNGICMLLIDSAILIGIILPYFQTLIVLILKRFIKDKFDVS